MTNSQHPPARICVIGAGPSGMAMIKRLKDHGLAYDCFEASDNIGGNWYYGNPNEMSACYRSLHIDTSKARFAFEDYPVPDWWPHYPHHSEIFDYLNNYVDHFDLRKTITFQTRVESAHREEDNSWTVVTSDGQTRHYDFLIVANGHHWSPRWPEPAYPGHFDGEQIHSHSYNSPFDPIDMVGKRVLVVGAGNSAMDIASECAQRSIADRLCVSMRHGVWIFPKYAGGKPADKLMMPDWIPQPVQRMLMKRGVKSLVGKMEDYGLPAPDHEPWGAHGTLSTEFLLRAGSGDITAKPGIDRLDGKSVHFVDGSHEDFDVIIWATGYNISFPFFDQPQFKADEKNVPPPLFKRMFIPGVDNLAYVGLAQALPTLVNFGEQQSKLIAEYLAGTYALPERGEMERTIAADDAQYLSRYYASARHTIQLDFYPYVKNLQKEIQAGRKRHASGAHGFRAPVDLADA